MRVRMMLFFVLVLPACHGWTWKNTVLETTFHAAAVVDHLQTRDIVARDGYEMNPILGEKPTMEAVGVYFLSAHVLHFVISALLPEDWRYAWQGASIGIEGFVLWSNYKTGVVANRN